MDLTERKLESSLAYQGHFFNVMKDTVRLPDGATSQREYVTHPGAVAVFAVLPDGRLVFERQYRYPVGRALLEIPAGKIDPEDRKSVV